MGASLVILDMGGTAVDTSNLTEKLILNVMSFVAQFEREMMLECQREGIAKAKAKGKYKGVNQRLVPRLIWLSWLWIRGSTKRKFAETWRLEKLVCIALLGS